jgi:hypothetical protein
MPTISRRIVKARKPHACGNCYQSNMRIEAGEQYVRLYGMACEGDPPYVLRLHLDCEKGWEAGA